MERSVYISARYPRANLLENISGTLARKVDETWESLDDSFYFDWRFAEADWDQLPALRAELEACEGVRYTEKWLVRHADQSGDLFQLEPPIWGDLEVVARSLSASLRCEGCGLFQRHLADKPTLSFQLPVSQPGLVFVQSAGVTLLAAEIWAALSAEGLDRGLATFPVDARGAVECDYVGLYSEVDLGWPAAPFGTAVGPCALCEGQTPRNAFYYIYDRPAVEADWMCTRRDGPSRLLVSERVFRWLKNAKATEGLKGKRLGWNPDEIDLAFLPERLQGTGA